MVTSEKANDIVNYSLRITSFISLAISLLESDCIIFFSQKKNIIEKNPVQLHEPLMYSL